MIKNLREALDLSLMRGDAVVLYKILKLVRASDRKDALLNEPSKNHGILITPLVRAICSSGKYASAHCMVRLLLLAGADPNGSCVQHHPLTFACMVINPACVKELLDAGADVHSHEAIRMCMRDYNNPRERLQCMEMLLSAGLNVTDQGHWDTNEDKTDLFYAVLAPYTLREDSLVCAEERAFYAATVALLLRAGAADCVNIPDDNYHSYPLIVAKTAAVMSLLLDAGAIEGLHYRVDCGLPILGTPDEMLALIARYQRAEKKN